MNPPPKQSTPNLELSGMGVYPGRLVQDPEEQTVPTGTPQQLLHLGNSDEQGPSEVRIVGDWQPIHTVFYDGQALTSNGELLYVLDVYPRAATARRHRCRLNHLVGDDQPHAATPNFISTYSLEEEHQGRGSRARADLILLARTNELSTFVTLDYQDHPDGFHRLPQYCQHELTNFLRRIRNAVGPVAWVEVLEYGEENYRLHHHLLMNKGIPISVINQKWTNGTAVTSRLRTLNGIGKKAAYLAKRFDDTAMMRPRWKRYRNSHNLIREQPIRLIGTRYDIESALQENFAQRTTIKEWQSKHSFSAGGYQWDRPI